MTTTLVKCIFIVLVAVLMTASCENNAAITKQSVKTNYTFDGTEGDAITLATANHWAANYSSQNSSAVKSHFFGSDAIKNVLGSSGCVGIRIYYSIDDAGGQQLLLIGANSKGNDLSPSAAIKGKASSMNLTKGSATDILNRSEGVLVSAEASRQWMTNYTSKNPSSLRAHFFGFEILNQILNQEGCIGIRMCYALNNSGIQQILLVGVNSNGENMLPSAQVGGKASSDDGIIADVSFPCPTHCSGS